MKTTRMLVVWTVQSDEASVRTRAKAFIVDHIETYI